MSIPAALLSPHSQQAIYVKLALSPYNLGPATPTALMSLDAFEEQCAKRAAAAITQAQGSRFAPSGAMAAKLQYLAGISQSAAPLLGLGGAWLAAGQRQNALAAGALSYRLALTLESLILAATQLLSARYTQRGSELAEHYAQTAKSVSMVRSALQQSSEEIGKLQQRAVQNAQSLLEMQEDVNRALLRMPLKI